MSQETSKEYYYLLSPGDKGEVSLEIISKEDAIKMTKEDEVEFQDHVPLNDSDYWEKPILIKGKIVVPKPVEKIIDYEID